MANLRFKAREGSNFQMVLSILAILKEEKCTARVDINGHRLAIGFRDNINQIFAMEKEHTSTMLQRLEKVFGDRVTFSHKLIHDLPLIYRHNSYPNNNPPIYMAKTSGQCDDILI